LDYKNTLKYLAGLKTDTVQKAYMQKAPIDFRNETDYVFDAITELVQCAKADIKNSELKCIEIRIGRDYNDIKHDEFTILLTVTYE